MAYDIRKKRVSPTLTFDLVDAEDQPLLNEDGSPCTCTVHGPGSKKYVAAQAKKQVLLMTKIQKGKAPTLTADEQIKNNAEFLADITEELDLDYEGKEGREKLVAIFSDTELGFVVEQILKKASDWANFSKRSETN